MEPTSATHLASQLDTNLSYIFESLGAGASHNISSPGFPGPYPPNVNCTWTITSPSGRIARTLNYFDVEVRPFSQPLSL